MIQKKNPIANILLTSCILWFIFVFSMCGETNKVKKGILVGVTVDGFMFSLGAGAYC
jgi:hypothetical protein